MTGIYPVRFWLKSTYSFGALVIATGLIWALVLTDKYFKLKKAIIIYIFALFFFFASFYNGFIVESYEAIYPGGAFVGEPGFGLILYSIFFLLAGILIIYNLILGHRRAVNKEEKTRLRYILYGAFATLGVSFLTSLVFPILAVYQFSGLDSIGFLIFLFCLSYAVIKYHLLDIRVIATEIFTFILWILLIIKLIISKNYQDLLINTGLFLAVVIFGILLIKSILKEVKQRQKLEVLTKEIKEAYEVEKKAHRELQRLDEAKNQFIMATQHHLRTPLTSMLGYLDLIFGGTYGKLPPRFEDPLQKFMASTRRLIRIVNEILDISQFQLGKKVVTLRPNASIEPTLKEIKEELEFEAKNKNLYLKIERPQKLPFIKADSQKLKVALFNIVDNAIKYTKEGGITIKIKGEKGKLLIMVKDTGIGIPKEDIPHLFGRTFERGEEAKKTFTTGRGIGLYIAGQIVKAHHGRIWAESDGKGKGSTFYIQLPLG
ncbi:MAG: ATP-binding protein [Candidatus Pacebacteria bacterium]|nr:ATP-binding protein [Candidatus Paceibacterota bacterium]